MKKTALCAAFLLSFTTLLYAHEPQRGLQISLSSDDPHAHFGPRVDARDVRLAITTRDGSTSLILTNDTVAVQLTDAAVANIKTHGKGGLFEDLVVSSVRTLLTKSLSYSIADLRDAQIVDGALDITQNDGKPLFTEVKVNGTEVLRNFSTGDAAKFVNAFRAMKRAR